MREGKHPSFLDSPITEQLEAKDICIYAPGDLNKVGKEGKTSWDSFSYAIQMGHNVWSHINAVQEANRLADVEKYRTNVHYTDYINDKKSGKSNEFRSF